MRLPLQHSPQEMVAILASATTDARHPQLDALLERFRREWRTLARLRYPGLGDEVDDLIQLALLRLVSPGKLAMLQDASLVKAWARSVFVNAVLDHLRERRRERERRRWLGGADEDTDTILRDRIPCWRPTPEDEVRDRERLAIALDVVSRLDIARKRFIDDMPEQAIAAEVGTTRDAVAGQLKRLRRRLREALGEHE